MKQETITIKLLSMITIVTGLIIISSGLKDTGWKSEEKFCFGPGFIVTGMILKFWFNDMLIYKLEAKRTIIKIFELILFNSGIIIFSYGLKDTSWDAEEITLGGGVLLALGYCLRDWTIVNREQSISNSIKLYLVIFGIACLTFLSSIYSNSEDCNCEDQLNHIENKIENLDRYY
jgi:hypothetical protein